MDVEVKRYTHVTTKKWKLEEIENDIWRVYLDEDHIVTLKLSSLDELRAAIEAAVRETL